MVCPRCGRPGKKQFKGYCTEVHLLLSDESSRDVIRLFCSICGRPLFRVPSKVPKKGKPVCARCPKNQGENHGNFKGARYQDPSGYIHILVKGHYKLEHRHIWQTANRASLLYWQPVHIHHIDFDKSNNDPDNLLVLMDKEHSRIHKLLKLGRRKQAYEIMHERALQQFHYPRRVDLYKEDDNQKKDVPRKSKKRLSPTKDRVIVPTSLNNF